MTRVHVSIGIGLASLADDVLNSRTNLCSRSLSLGSLGVFCSSVVFYVHVSFSIAFLLICLSHFDFLSFLSFLDQFSVSRSLLSRMRRVRAFASSAEEVPGTTPHHVEEFFHLMRKNPAAFYLIGGVVTWNIKVCFACCRNYSLPVAVSPEQFMSPTTLCVSV